MKIQRLILHSIIRSLKSNPVTALLGPRQCGKTTLIKMLREDRSDVLYMDLERPDDQRALSDPQAFFRMNRDKIICLDEIQNVPDLFPVMRSEVDEVDAPGRFIVLGSASPQLLRQTSESLAGRIRYVEMTPFLLREIDYSESALRQLWLRGGFPRSYLASSDEVSYEWRQDFIRTFLERDIPSLGFRIPGNNMRRFWTMLTHLNAQVLNRSKLGEALGVSHHTVQRHLDLLVDCYMIRALAPLEVNVRKRLVKSPKIYFRDTGILHALAAIPTANTLMSHPSYGSSWESFALETICGDEAVSKQWQFFFYCAHGGGEIDLVLDNGSKRIAVEFKASSAPQIPSSFPRVLRDIECSHGWIIAPVKMHYQAQQNILVGTPLDFIRSLQRN